MSVMGALVAVRPDEIAFLQSGESSVQDTVRAWVNDARAFQMDKQWAGIHFLLTGHAEGGDGPAAFLGAEHLGEEIDADLGYGPPRVFDPEATRAVRDALDRVPPAVLDERLASVELATIYPFSLRTVDDADRTRLRDALDEVRRYVGEAVARTAGLVVVHF